MKEQKALLEWGRERGRQADREQGRGKEQERQEKQERKEEPREAVCSAWWALLRSAHMAQLMVERHPATGDD